MNLENTIVKSIEAYPLIYPFRYYVLVHLFLSIGNGCEWINGELCQMDPLEKWTPAKWKKYNFRNIDNKILQMQHIVDTSVERSKNKIEIPTHLYPGSIKYSCICNFPSNITKSWKNGIIEFSNRLLEKDIEQCENFEIARELSQYGIKKLKKIGQI